MNSLEFGDGRRWEAPEGTSLLDLFLETWWREEYSRNGFAVQAGQTVVDIGAHVGTFTLFAAMRGATVYAYEPSPENYRLLIRNVAATELKSTVYPHEMAVGREVGEADLFFGETSTRNVLHGRDIEFQTALTSKTRVHVASLDSIMAPLETCDLVKIDCEGAEYDILGGASMQTLQRINRIAMEYHTAVRQGDPAGLESILHSAGFTTTIQRPERGKPWGFLWAAR